MVFMWTIVMGKTPSKFQTFDGRVVYIVLRLTGHSNRIPYDLLNIIHGYIDYLFDLLCHYPCINVL